MELTRRNFLSGAAVAAGAVGMGTFAATSVANADEAEAAEEAAEEYTYADTIAWNAEYDVVVVGFGCAGGTAAIYAADAGAQVLLCDAAPAGYEGGNSRVACRRLASVGRVAGRAPFCRKDTAADPSGA